MALLLYIILLFILYSNLIFYYWKNWESLPEFKKSLQTATIKISIIIPARNEEQNIGQLLKRLQNQTYPSHLFEIIVVDDHSTDRTREIVQQFSTILLIALKEENLNSYKKKAIEIGIAAATGELIVTTDADCLPDIHWLHTIASFKEEMNSVFVAAPVVMNNNSSILQQFQAMDFMVLQGITGAAVSQKKLSMCNGANIAYERTSFYIVNGFTGIEQLASGDDMLLMNKIWKKFPNQVHYLKSKEAIVATEPMKTWKDFFNQRIRWASKAKSYDDKRIFPILLLVYVFNLSFLLLLIAGFWNSHFWFYLIALWIAKTIIELPLFLSLSAFFNKKRSALYFLFFQPLHIFYTIIAGFLGQFGKYEWKGRKVK